MRFRIFTFLGGMTVAVSLAHGQVAAPPPKPVSSKSRAYRAPRTIYGQPDLEGVWANNTATPLERPLILEGRAFLTDEELAALKKKAGELFNGEGDNALGDSVFLSVLATVKGTEKGIAGPASLDIANEKGDYNSVWTVDREWDNRTSLITNPADGRLPAMTPEGQQRHDAALAALARPPSGPEDRSLTERCITYGSPRFTAGYNSYYQIVQSAHSVVIESEMIHDARIVPLDNRPHLPSVLRKWMGDPRGHWEGETLVVDSTNYRTGALMYASSEKLHVIERFTRTGPKSIKYEVTINDPETWTKPWSAMIPLQWSEDVLFEYACHEGNIAMQGILSGARAGDKAAAGSSPK